MEISVTQSTFRPIADLIESNRREHMSSFARLADVLLSLICVRPSSSQCAEIMAEQLKMSLYEIMTDSSETEITLLRGITLSVNTHEKKATLSNPNGPEVNVPYGLLLSACLNVHPLPVQPDGFYTSTTIHYEKNSPEEETEQFIVDQIRGSCRNTTVAYRDEDSREYLHLNGDRLQCLADALIERKKCAGTFLDKNESATLVITEVNGATRLSQKGIFRIASVCNQGFVSSLSNNVAMGVRDPTGTIRVVDGSTMLDALTHVGVPMTLSAHLLNRTSLSKESRANHTLEGEDITSTWSDVDLPVYDVIKQEWECHQCDVTLSDFQNGTARLSVSFPTP
ncbi:hypothetical protein [Lonsdalea quercina]|uniref:hypothetical protein n=1 Tax=Lonsdalea quercina TaxID=71657 RepID=UPI003976C781